MFFKFSYTASTSQGSKVVTQLQASPKHFEKAIKNFTNHRT